MSKVLVDRNVLEQILDSLEYIRSTTVWQADKHAANPAIAALRAAMEQPEQDAPVAFADQISFDEAMKSGKGHDVWPEAGDYEARTGRKLRGLYARPLGPHPDTVRLAYLYSGTQTSSDALVNAEMKLLNGETLTLEEARAAIDDAMSKPMKY